MVDNDITSIPNPVNEVAGHSADCTTGSQEMDAFPDKDTVNTAKTDPATETAFTASDLGGYFLFGHDITSNSSATGLVNYMGSDKTSYCYTTTADGTITQYKTDGTQTNP